MRNRNHLVILIIFAAFMLLFLPLVCAGQRNTIYLSLNPKAYLGDFGKGIAYERQFKAVGAYLGVTEGKYSFQDAGRLHNIRLASGVTKIVYKHEEYKAFLVGGVNYSALAGNVNIDVPDRAYRHFGIDIGFGAKIKRITVIVTYDKFKNQSTVNLGYSFNLIK
jgi:hypothetical protein